MQNLTRTDFYIYLTICILRIRIYVRFTRIGAKTALSSNPNIYMVLYLSENQCVAKKRHVRFTNQSRISVFEGEASHRAKPITY